MSFLSPPSASLVAQMADLDALMGDSIMDGGCSEDRWAQLQALAQAHGLTMPSAERVRLGPGPSVQGVPERAGLYRRAGKRCGAAAAKALACLVGAWGLMALGIPAGWSGPVHLADWGSGPCLVVIGAAALIGRAVCYGLDVLWGTAVEVLSDLNA